MMATITISRQLGSLGSQVAQHTADLLGYRLVWRDLIHQAARRAGAPEMALAVIDELRLFGLCPSPQACQAYRRAVEQIMQELADQGDVVIQGRAGQIILKDRPDTLHVRIIAPKDLRVERITQKLGITVEQALAQVEASDRYRANYLRRFYQARWDDPALYHLVLNTANLSPVQAGEIICQAVTVCLPSMPHTSNSGKGV
jgi:cytidylate kinase